MPRARENADDQVAIGFSFESDWLRKWREFSKQIIKRSEVKQNQSNLGVTFDTQLKIAFNFETITSQTGNVLFCDNLSEKFGTAK